MKTRELAFEFALTLQTKSSGYIKASYRKVIELTEGDNEGSARQGLADDVCEFVVEKVTEAVGALS